MPPPLSLRNFNVNAARSLSYRPTAVFVGGTSGIGEGMARAFGRHTGGDSRIVLVGRNTQAAEEVIGCLPRADSLNGPRHKFVASDLTLMSNVRKMTAKLHEKLPKVNFLVLSPGIMSLQGRTETEEGIDRKLALHYYARWRIIHDLIPLLQKAKDAGEDAKVMTVLSAGVHGGKIDLDDLGLKKGYSPRAAARSASTYNDLMVQSFADRHPDLAFTHIAPGRVQTPIYHGLTQSHWTGRVLGPLSVALSHVIASPPEDTAEYMWRGLYVGEKGWFRRNRHGEDIGERKLYSNEESKEKLWAHTLETTSEPHNASTATA